MLHGQTRSLQPGNRENQPLRGMAMPGNELVQFAEYEEPGLKAGDYEVRATLSLKNLPAAAFAASPNAEPRYEDTKYLRVQGDQYALSPGTVESVYPPD